MSPRMTIIGKIDWTIGSTVAADEWMAKLKLEQFTETASLADRLSEIHAARLRDREIRELKTELWNRKNRPFSEAVCRIVSRLREAQEYYADKSREIDAQIAQIRAKIWASYSDRLGQRQVDGGSPIMDLLSPEEAVMISVQRDRTPSGCIPVIEVTDSTRAEAMCRI